MCIYTFHSVHAVLSREKWIRVIFFSFLFVTLYPGEPGGERILDVVPGGRSSELRLRREVGQAAHTLSNPQVECTEILLCVIRE